jgi:imidazolonepropionase
MNIDLLIHSAAQLITCASPGGPKRGSAMRELGLINAGAVAVNDGRIVALGASEELRACYQAHETLDASGCVVCPGFVDPHTHVVYAGERLDEFEQRIGGASYMELMAAGGGILATVRATRAASAAELTAASRRRLDAMLQLGTTTAEAKTGYGLELATELRQLEVIAALDRSHTIDLVPTFLGAHAVPPEFAGRADEYSAQVATLMLPAVANWYHGSDFARRGVPFFVDVFCERNAFDLAQSRQVLTAGQALGLPLKAHVDEFTQLGALELALELGATSVDHLDVTDAAGIARLAAGSSIGVIIPTVPFNLGSSHYADARAMLDAGAALALTTDINPGSAPCPSMPLAMAIACRYQHLLPSEALCAATINAAHAIGLGDQVGSLEAGKCADLLIVAADDYRQLAYQLGANLVRTVIKRGQVV